jgi:hypothetical protein
MTRYRQFCTRCRQFYADIVHDMTPVSVNIGVYPFLATTDIVSFFTDIGVEVNIGPDITPISVSYWCIPVSWLHRYWVFRRYRPRNVPDIANNITIYRHRRQFSTTSFPMSNQYHNIPISTFHDIGVNYTISGPPAPMPRRQPPPASRAGRRRATAQALQQVQPLDPRHARTFCRPGGLPSIHRAAAAQAPADSVQKTQ